MNLKKMIFINIVLTFGLCFLTHFLYEWLPNPIFAVFFPVNESIWEHMKMLYTTILLYGIVEYFIMKWKDIDNHNFLLTLFIKAIISIPIYLIMFLPLYYLFGENMFIFISVMLITIIIINIIGYKLLQTSEIPNQNFIAILLIGITYLVMGILTFKTPELELFFDPKNEKYGINDSIKKGAE